MGEPSCSFQVECEFHKTSVKTVSDAMLVRLFCYTRFDICEIAKRISAGIPVPAGACPDGNVRA
jgi:hypothetical protein